ncbi:SRPBCC family protein [Arthrobacter sp. L77]|uniref:SRPBCC family protein n=1 Tax=Arthrobacter sp. L77 TaxID=1496689 RepID=UPI0009E4CD0D|nr:SRPBCC family protein [Arthrobacter sp. L77]
MTEASVVNSTFTIEHDYAIGPTRLFEAWADPDTKARWFAGAAADHHELDFKVGGLEITRGRTGEGELLTFASRYHDIVVGERIVYSSTLSVREAPVTVSLTTVQFQPQGDHTTLTLTEHAVYLDGHEQPKWREHGTRHHLATLEAELTAPLRQI